MQIKESDNHHFTSYFTPDDIICPIDAETREDAFLQILKQLAYNRGIGNVNRILKMVLDRDDGFTTVLTDGLALPHARLTTISDLVVGIGISPDGIRFPNEKVPVKIIILILTPKENPSLYLQVLSSMSKALQEKGMTETLSKMTNADDVWKFFNRSNLDFPDYICAGDIMEPNPVTLREHQTLEDAINLFVQKSLNDVPVIDNDGEMVGVVTAQELLKVCLPDYILWMDDLSPILNFEPFSHILQNESSTWLAEIMSQDYAVIDEKDPAISVAQEITKKKATRAYVLRGKKLIGTISLRQFLNKILRE